MRLVCPNCDAQYEVGEDAIPENGRDVQCSNCGHTWFEAHGKSAAQDTDDESNWTDPSEGDEAGDSDPAPQSASAGSEFEPPEAEDDEGEDDQEPVRDPADLPRRKPLDEGVSAILREEAELEKSAREAEGGAAIETQPDLGIDGGDSTSQAVAATVAVERVARLRGANPEPEEPQDSNKRRDLLPDIEEINSTLRSTSDRKGEENEPPATQEEYQSSQRRGFRRGFSVAVIIIALMFVVYRFSGDLAERFPQVEPYLADYVSMIDGWRVVLDRWALAAAEKVSTWTDGT